MVHFWLFAILLLSYGINSSVGQCILEGSPAGEVFEYAPADKIVLSLNYDGDISDITITLDSKLDPYFRLNGKTLLVSGTTNITRDISFSGAQVSCSSGGSPTTNSVFITVKDINSVNDVKFEESLYEETLPETQDVGSRIEVKANDEDVSSLSYNIDAQDPPGFFELIGSNSGILELIKPLDYKSNQQHTLTITATSSGFNNVGAVLEQTDSTQVTVTVTDVDNLPPEFQPCDNSGIGTTCVSPLYTASVSADQSGPVDVQPPILAVDGDDGINSPITYQFVDGTPTYLDYFTIDSSTAEVTLKSGIDVAIDRFVIAVEAREDSGKASIAYLVIDVVIVDDFKPEFQPGPRLGYISQSSYDNNIVAIVTEDEDGNVPLKLTVSDDDDPQATFAYEVTPPYLVSSDGYVYFAPSASANYQTDDIEITAINLNAKLNSPNRISDSITLTIETVANPTTPEPTTIEPTTPIMTTEATTEPSTTTEATTTVTTEAAVATTPALSTTSAQTTQGSTTSATSYGTFSTFESTNSFTSVTSVIPDQATDQETESTTPFTCPPVSTPDPCPTVLTTEACPTCSCAETTATTPTEESETVTPFTCPSVTTPEPCPTIEPCANVTTVEPCPTVPTTEACPTCSCTDGTTTAISVTTPEPCPTIEPCANVTTVEPCPTVPTTEACPTCSCTDGTTTAISESKTTVSETTCPTPTCPACTDAASTVEGDISITTTTAVPTSCPVCQTGPTLQTTETTRGQVIIPYGYVAEEILYGVAGGLSGAVLICIIIIIVLACKKSSKGDDLEKNKLLNSETKSVSPGESRYPNPAFEEEVVETPKQDANFIIAPTSFSTQPEAKVTSSPDDDSGTEVNGYEEQSLDQTPPVVPHYEAVVESEEEEEEEVSDFASQIKKGAAVMAAAAATAAVYENVTVEKDDKNVPVVLAAAAVASTSFDDDDSIQDYGSAYKKSQVVLDRILKDGDYAQSKLVTIQRYGIDKEDTKSVVKIVKLSKASFTEISSLQAQIRLLQKACEQDHENILQYCGMHEDGDELHCALMYAPNGNLLEYMQPGSNKRALSSYDMINTISGVGRGLQYLHAKNIVHCHLQCRYIMLDANLVPKIRDFENNEVSSIKENDNRARWQAVEVLHGDLSTAPSDVWSFGVVMWEIASRGSLPYADVHDDDVKKYLDDDHRLQIPVGCSETLFSIIESCWNADPRFRPDMYVLVSNLAEKLTEDAAELIGMDVNGSRENDRVSPDEISISVDEATPSNLYPDLSENNEEGYTMF